MNEPISGKVIRILNDREVVVNRGSLHGLSEGDYVGVIDPNVETIEDPDTGEILGGIRRYSVTLRVSQVSDRLAIASTYRTKQVNVGGIGGFADPFAKMLEPRRVVNQVERLQIEKDEIDPVDGAANRVLKGDPFEVISQETADSGFTLLGP